MFNNLLYYFAYCFVCYFIYYYICCFIYSCNYIERANIRYLIIGAMINLDKKKSTVISNDAKLKGKYIFSKKMQNEKNKNNNKTKRKITLMGIEPITQGVPLRAN